MWLGFVQFQMLSYYPHDSSWTPNIKYQTMTPIMTTMYTNLGQWEITTWSWPACLPQ
ncbi:hypothetical protein CKAH01_16711 [Colletotrichum kahawae]|uniref:Uncharacterized protein n=1 Tax=Colletotrichum kahawae TaxID=34407 RepID=A0AAE0D848_COLKA|nr:hypothetical protein CKAH01_16711 [Colletotrichum kahawae]